MDEAMTTTRRLPESAMYTRPAASASEDNGGLVLFVNEHDTTAATVAADAYFIANHPPLRCNSNEASR